MDSAIFKKMRMKPGKTACVLYAPEDYPESGHDFNAATDKCDFVHLFAASRAEFEELIPEALRMRAENALLWISYKV